MERIPMIGQRVKPYQISNKNPGDFDFSFEAPVIAVDLLRQKHSCGQKLSQAYNFRFAMSNKYFSLQNDCGTGGKHEKTG